MAFKKIGRDFPWEVTTDRRDVRTNLDPSTIINLVDEEKPAWRARNK